MGVHHLAAPGAEVVCRHVLAAQVAGYCCVPLLAEGQALGILHLATGPGEESEYDESRLVSFAENAALALHNIRLRQALRDSAIRDPLSGLFNRRYMEELIALEEERSRRSGAPISVLMIDIDHFKRFNDTFGHYVGDLVIKELARSVRSTLRKGDVACRYGGEEFLCIMPGMGADAAMERAESILAATRQISLGDRGPAIGQVTCSIGVASYPSHAPSLLEALSRADEALYAAKRAGRDRALLPQKETAVADQA